MFVNVSDTIHLFIFFKLTIFVILVIQMWQLSSQLIIPFLRERIRLLEERFDNLLRKKKLLYNTKYRINQEIETQSARLNSLDEKIKQWHSSMLKDRESLLQRAQEVQDELKEKKKKQGAWLALVGIERDVLPLSISQAENELREMYSGSKGDELVKDMIRNMN